MGVLDTGLAMGASESMRAGFVNALPEKKAKVISLIGDGTECHTGLDGTRNTLFRNIGGLKIVLDNEWIAMTGGQPSPNSPINLAGTPSQFDLVKTLESEGAEVLIANAYNYKELQEQLSRVSKIRNK